MTVIIKSDKTISSPYPWVPKVPDLDTGLLIDIDPATLDLTDGAAVTSIVASGTGSERQRTFDNTAQDWPTWSATGGAGGAPALMFTGNRSIRAANNTTDFTAYNTPQPFTLAGVARHITLPTIDTVEYQRILSIGVTDTAGGFVGVRPRADGTGVSFDSSIGGENYSPVFPAGGEHEDYAFIAVFNGAASRVKIFGRPIAPASFGTTPLRPIALGTTYGVSPISSVYNLAFRGTISRIMVYDRALSDNDINSLNNLLADTYQL